jgi:hypothetical protein
MIRNLRARLYITLNSGKELSAAGFAGLRDKLKRLMPNSEAWYDVRDQFGHTVGFVNSIRFEAAK